MPQFFIFRSPIKMMHLVIALSVWVYVVNTNSVDRFTNNKDLQFGFGSNCYLYWRGDSGNTKNAEFRCKKASGDHFWIEKRSGLYAIGTYVGGLRCPLYWRGDSGNVKNAEFRCGEPISDLFWIRPQANGLFAIGFSNCPLYWRGDEGDTKNGEFRCGKPISDLFWIKGDGCKISKVNIIDNGADATYEGEEIVGITAAGSCSKGESELQLTHTKEVTEEVSLGISKSLEFNWQVSASVTVEASAKFLGSGGSVSATVGYSVGGAVTYESSRTKSTSSGTSSGSAVTVKYFTPGGAMIVGFVKRYKFDKSNIPAEVTVQCKGGYQFTYNTNIQLTSKTYGHTFYKHYTGTFSPGKCTDSRVSCLYRTLFLIYKSIWEAKSTFDKCFPPQV